MANILFVALQCVECSTMQVKQRKNSSNKWVCVVCNQKQSVKRVFAQGYKAKELRFFVQSFNMSRKVADETELDVADTVDYEGGVDEDVCGKKRSDWSEYLDYSDLSNDRPRPIVEEEDDVKIVTEMPSEMFKRPKLNKYCNAGGSSSVTGGDELFNPSFSRRNSVNKPDGVVARKKGTEERCMESERVTKPASKWDAFLVDDQGESRAPLRTGKRDVVKGDGVGEWDKAIMEISSEYQQIVDDEVHPDFM